MMPLRERIARWLAPDREARLDTRAANIQKQERDLDLLVNNRVADIVLKMDPWEPLLKRFNVVFSEEWERPEDKLDSQSQMRLFMWAYTMKTDPSFRYLTDWLLNTQGNHTVRKAKNENEWFFGRAAIATIILLKDQIGRLSGHYEEMLANKEKDFDKNLAVE